MRRNLVIRIFGIGMVAAVVLASPAGAKTQKPKRKTTRTETYQYTGPSGVAANGSTVQVCAQDQGCFSLAAQPKEQYVSLTGTDQTGTPVGFLVSVNGVDTSYCGATDDPIWLNGAKEIDVKLVTGGAPDCPGVVTTGSFDATFSNLP